MAEGPLHRTPPARLENKTDRRREDKVLGRYLHQDGPGSSIWRRLSMLWEASTCPECHDDWHIVEIDLLQGDDIRSLSYARFLEELRLPTDLCHRIEQYARRGIRHMLIPIHWDLPVVSQDPQTGAWIPEEVSHATVLLVDTQDRVFGLYDPEEHSGGQWGFWVTVPWSETPVAMDFVAFMQIPEADILPGYRPLAADEMPRQHHRPLQTLVENTSLLPRTRSLHYPEGLCTLLCALVMLCCRRLNHWNPWAVSAAIATIYQHRYSDVLREAFRHNLFWWYRSIHSGQRWPRLEERCGLLNPRGRMTSGMRKRVCMVDRDGRAGDFCPETPCKGHALCAWHRHSMFEPRRSLGVAPDCDRPLPWSQYAFSWPAGRALREGDPPHIVDEHAPALPEVIKIESSSEEERTQQRKRRRRKRS